MSKRAFGSLADLAKILEEASNPESTVREDRQRPKVEVEARPSTRRILREIDPKRKAWYQKRLKERTATDEVAPAPETTNAAPMLKTESTRSAATRLGGSLLQTLAAVDAKPKTDAKKPEAWRRKPGDPVF